MAVSDSIADFLIRIKNGQKARFDKVDIPASRLKASMERNREILERLSR